MSPINIKRPLLFTTTAFLFLYPVCLAEAATTSSFGSLPRKSPTLQTATATQQQSLPKTSQGQLQSALESPSFSQSLESLQSTLTSLRAQLQQLSTQIADSNKLATAQTLLSTLQSQIDATKRLQPQYTAQTILLKNAIERYESAKLRTATALEAHQLATTNQLTTSNALQQAQEAERQALLALNSKKTAATQAAQNLASANDALTDAALAVTSNLTALTAAENAYTEALSSFNEASANLQNLQQQESQRQILDPNWTRPPIPATTTTTTNNGLTATTYNRQGYNNAPPLPTADETPLSTQIVQDINFNWGGGYVLNSGRAEDVLVKFTGYIILPETKDYQFYAPGDDGVKLFINNTQLIDDWYDKGGGGSISPTIRLEANTPYEFTLYFYENGGGANVWLYTYNPNLGFQLVPASYFGSSTTTTTTYVPDPNAVHPLITDPNYMQELDAATTTFNRAEQNLNTANSALSQAQELYDAKLLTKTQAESAQESAFTANQLATQEQQTQQAVYDAAQSELLIKTENHISSNLALTSSAAELEAATFDEEAASTNQEETYTRTQNLKTQLETSHEEAVKTSAAASQEVSTLKPDPAPIPEPEPEPEPQPEPEKLPEVISAEALQEIDLTKIDPQTITPEQVTALQEAAYETFETAEQGSAEYEQALDALYLAAEADDIEVPEELAALPAIGPALAGAVELVNFLGNAGADMSPKVREESKKVVVTAVVAAGAAIQSAAAAASMSSASTTRRIGN